MSLSIGEPDESGTHDERGDPPADDLDKQCASTDGTQRFIDQVRRVAPAADKHENFALGRRVQAGLRAEKVLAEVAGNSPGDRRAELQAQVEDGRRAAGYMFNANLRLPIGWALKRHGQLPLDVAISYAIEGLPRAIRNYDPERGFTFATFAMFYIINQLQKGRAAEHFVFSIPTHVSQRADAFWRKTEEETLRRGRPLTLDDLLELDPSAETHCMLENRRVLPIDMPLGDTGLVLADILPDPDPAPSAEDEAIRNAELALMSKLLPQLGEPALIIVTRRHSDEPDSKQDLAIGLKISRQMVTLIEDDALSLLREAISASSETLRRPAVTPDHPLRDSDLEALRLASSYPNDQPLTIEELDRLNGGTRTRGVLIALGRRGYAKTAGGTLRVTSKGRAALAYYSRLAPQPPARSPRHPAVNEPPPQAAEAA